ncbi:MAG: hypothetical protein JST54_07045 [Deltaproteobacteria bacterium]|nr:hypothetical protein [Deltaproteobacteria bacterium]
MQIITCPLCVWVKLRLGKEVEACAESEWRTREIRAHVYAQHVPELPSHRRPNDAAQPTLP